MQLFCVVNDVNVKGFVLQLKQDEVKMGYEREGKTTLPKSSAVHQYTFIIIMKFPARHFEFEGHVVGREKVLPTQRHKKYLLDCVCIDAMSRRSE